MTPEHDILDVRRLAAIDMHGAQGARRRRLLILAEFALGAVGLLVVGAAVLRGASTPLTVLWGVWLVGIGANYTPLTVHAISLARPDTLHAELTGLDLGRELRRYSVKQVWIAVPFLLAVLSLWQAARRRRA